MTKIEKDLWNAKVWDFASQGTKDSRVVIEPGDWTHYDFHIVEREGEIRVYGSLLRPRIEDSDDGRVVLSVTDCKEFFERHQGFIDEQNLLNDPLYEKFGDQTNPWTRQATLKAIYLAWEERQKQEGNKTF